MRDKRIEAGPALGLENPGDRLGVRGVAREAVDRLGGQDDKLAAAQGLGRRLYRRVAVRFTLTFTSAGI